MFKIIDASYKNHFSKHLNNNKYLYLFKFF
jgi:hypothetical protein